MAVRRARPPVAVRPVSGRLSRHRSWILARSVLLEFPAVRARLAEATSFEPSRRLAEALEPSSDPVVVARMLDETDQARGLIEERPGIGIGAARDIGPAIERAARGGRLDPSQFLEIAETLDATARLATSPGRRAAAAAARARPASCMPCRPCARRWRAASTRSASCSTPPRRGSAGCGRRSGWPTTACAGGSTRSSDRSSAGRSRSRSSRSATGATWCRSRPRRGAGSRASSTTRRAAARRCSSSRSSRSSWAMPGARRRSPRPRRSRASSTSCRRSSRPTPRRCARRSMRSPGSTCGPPRRRSPPISTGPVPRPRRGPRSSSCRPATPGSAGASCRSTSGSGTATPRSW